MNIKKRIGDRYGALTVIAFEGSIEDSPGHKVTMWRCVCDCGKETVVRRPNLANAKSCGCQRKYHTVEIEAGQKFGKLTAVSPNDERIAGHRAWSCSCDCGTSLNVAASELQRGQQSCGCDKREKSRLTHRKAPGLAGKKALFSSYRNRAKNAGMSLTIDFDRFVELTSQSCFYCGRKPSSVMQHGNSEQAKQHSSYIYNGLDRIRNEDGYHEHNVVTCCSVCNYARNTMGQDDFIQWIDQASRHLFGDRK